MKIDSIQNGIVLDQLLMNQRRGGVRPPRGGVRIENEPQPQPVQDPAVDHLQQNVRLAHDGF